MDTWRGGGLTLPDYRRHAEVKKIALWTVMVPSAVVYCFYILKRSFTWSTFVLFSIVNDGAHDLSLGGLNRLLMVSLMKTTFLHF